MNKFESEYLDMLLEQLSLLNKMIDVSDNPNDLERLEKEKYELEIKLQEYGYCLKPTNTMTEWQSLQLDNQNLEFNTYYINIRAKVLKMSDDLIEKIAFEQLSDDEIYDELFDHTVIANSLYRELNRVSRNGIWKTRLVDKHGRLNVKTDAKCDNCKSE